MSELRRRKDAHSNGDNNNGDEGLIEEPVCPVEVFEEKKKEEKEEEVKDVKENKEKEKEKEEEEINDPEVERIQKEIEAFKELVLKRFDGISKDVTALKRKSKPAEKQPGDSIEKLKKTNTINEKKIKLMVYQHKQEVRYLEEGKKKYYFLWNISYIFIFIENRKLKRKLNDLLNQNQKNYCFLFVAGLALMVVIAGYFLH